jgi:hypothetical protein
MKKYDHCEIFLDKGCKWYGYMQVTNYAVDLIRQNLNETRRMHGLFKVNMQ